MTTFYEIAKIHKVNDTDQEKVNSIKAAISDGSFDAPALLVWEDMNQSVTGSHRIEAVRQLVEEDEERWENDEMETIDVSEVMFAVECPEYDNLRGMFEGTEFEDEARKNTEW
jgi:uncharacterized protein YcbX